MVSATRAASLIEDMKLSKTALPQPSCHKLGLTTSM
jgi:hypothetical protein